MGRATKQVPAREALVYTMGPFQGKIYD
jgi:hypothetical protein